MSSSQLKLCACVVCNENRPLLGLKQKMDDTDLIRGVWTWGRGGGWQGPYITGGGNGIGGALGGGAAGEFWEDMNAYVVSQWVAAQLAAGDTTAAPLSEEVLFQRYCTDVLGLNGELHNNNLRSSVYFTADF